MNSLPQLLENNRNWTKNICEHDPDFFQRLSEQQHPEYLWIGCSDSRIRANEITGLRTGEIFVHRNIANLVVHTDMNLLSVLQYAVDILEVKHVMVVGHYGCGGVCAAMENSAHGLIDNWLRHIQDVAKANRAELAKLEGEAMLDRLCELNVVHQADNVARTGIVQEAWKRGQELKVHAWIYSLKKGFLKPLQNAIAAPPA